MSSPNFNAIAPYYDRLAYFIFGETIKNAQTYFLEEIKAGHSVIIVGGGTGWILQDILSRNPGKVCFVEPSEKMLKLAREKIERHGLENVQLINVDIRDFREAGQFDVLITFFFLDIFSPKGLREIMDLLSPRLKNSGKWLFCDFQVCRGNWWQKMFVSGMYIFFRIVSGIKARHLPDFFSSFSRLGWETVGEKTFYHGMIISRVFKRKPQAITDTEFNTGFTSESSP